MALLDSLELDCLRSDLELVITGDTSLNGVGGDTCQISRTDNPNQLGTFNETTGLYENPTVTIKYTGPCYISPLVFRRDRQEEVGGRAGRIRVYRVKIPWVDPFDVELMDNFVITQSADGDSEILDLELKVVDILYGSEGGARRITVQDFAES
jgi:hypothetical protein